MSSVHCFFCESANPEGSRFCNHCGAQLNLVPCPRCGAVNESGMPACVQCSASLLRADAVQPEADASGPPAVVSDTGDDPRAETHHRVDALDLIEAEIRQLPASTPQRRKPAVHRTIGAALLALVLLLITGYVIAPEYLSRTSSTASPDQAASSARPIRAQRPVPVGMTTAQAGGEAQSGQHDAQGLPVLETGPDGQARDSGRTACSAGVAALGLCGYANPTP